MNQGVSEIGLVMLALSIVVTLINTVIVATTRAAVSELKAELLDRMAKASSDAAREFIARAEFEHIERRVRRLEET